MRTAKVAELIISFRGWCLKTYENDQYFIPEERKQDYKLKEEDEFFSLFGNSQSTLVWYIAKSLPTPRLLKQVLRRTKWAWDHLHGEIDFDDLFVVTTLRFAFPTAFLFLVEHIVQIRNSRKSNMGNTEEKRVNDLNAKWEGHCKKYNLEYPVSELVQFLFPVLLRQIDLSSQPQKLFHDIPTDYWKRYLEEKLLPNELSDQNFLGLFAKHIKEFQAESRDASLDKEVMSNLLENKQFCDKIDQFASLVVKDSEYVRYLASMLFDGILKTYGVQTNVGNIPGFSAIWRLSLHVLHDKSEYEEWFVKQIVHSATISMRFMSDQFYYWSHSDQNSVSPEWNPIELRRSILRLLKGLFEPEPDLFVNSIDSSFIPCLARLSNSLIKPVEDGAGVSRNDWDWFPAIIMITTKTNPEILIPQIAGILVKTNNRIIGTSDLEFNELIGTKLFDDKFNDMCELVLEMSKGIEIEGMIETQKIAFLLETAKRVLNRKPNAN